jgi:hypothetical protein
MPPRKRKPIEQPKETPVTVESVDELYSKLWQDEEGNPVYHQPTPKTV